MHKRNFSFWTSMDRSQIVDDDLIRGSCLCTPAGAEVQARVGSRSRSALSGRPPKGTLAAHK
jgi:hypothetical protein